MKNAKLAKLACIVTVEMTCPYCGGDIVDPQSGSFNLAVADLSRKQTVQCNDCFEWSLVPDRVFRLDHILGLDRKKQG